MPGPAARWRRASDPCPRRAVKDASGNPVRLAATIQDITGLAQARQRLEQANRQNEALLNSAADGIHGLDLEGRITFVNSAAGALTGYPVEETLGRRQNHLVHHTRADGTPYPPEDCPCTGGPVHGGARTVCDEVFWRSDGTSFPVEYTTTPISQGDTLTGALVVFRDITERRRIESQLERLNSALTQQARRDPLTGSGIGAGWRRISRPTTRGESATATPTAYCSATSIGSRRSTTARATKRGTAS